MMKSSKFIFGESVPLPPGCELVPSIRKDVYRKGRISANNSSSDPAEIPEDEEFSSQFQGILVPLYFKNHDIYTRKEIVDINLVDALDRAGYKVEDIEVPFWSQTSFCFKGVLVDNIIPDTSDPIKQYDDKSSRLVECFANNPSMSKNIFVPIITDVDYNCSTNSIKKDIASVGCRFYFLSESGMLDHMDERFTFKGEIKREGEKILVSAQVNSHYPSIFRIAGILLEISTLA